MKECTRLQNLLKSYCGADVRKNFKGVKITQKDASSKLSTRSLSNKILKYNSADESDKKSELEAINTANEFNFVS